MPKSAPLHLSLSGVLVDQLTYQPSPFDLLDNSQRELETLVRDVTMAIHHAANDERITGLVLNLNPLQHGSFSKLEEIGDAVEAFKTSGKPVIAYADNFSQSQYFLASYADEIYLNRLGFVGITGFGFFGSYYKEATEKLSLKFHVFRVGDYKDAVEPYIRNDMSTASREHNSGWINELWDRYTTKIESSRELPAGALEAFVLSLKDSLKGSGLSYANLAENADLVDGVLSRIELGDLLIEKFGRDEDSGHFLSIPFGRYLRDIKPKFPPMNDSIGLIVASGTIIDGYAPEGGIGGDSLSNLIRQATEDTSLKALIIRVDSGGGSAFASELIREEIASARKGGLPVYISMGSVAASGGYWIATAADEVWALPSTITGSIGVWGLVPNLTNSLKRLGIHSDGFGTTPLADIYNLDRPMSAEAQQVFQNGVDNIYQEFLSLVAQARGISTEEVHAIAQGRVWTGEKALELGLVDRLGNLNELIEQVSQTVSVAKTNIKLIERPLSTSEQFMRALLEDTNALASPIRKALIGEDLEKLSAAIPMILPVEQTLTAVKSRGETIYAQCIACLTP